MSLAVGIAAAQAPQDPVPAAPIAGQARLGGIWKFNKDLSTDTSTMERSGQQPEPAGAGGRSGGGGGGGGYRGGGGGSRSGGGRGYGGGGGAGADPEQMLQFKALTREVAEAPERLTIVVSDVMVEFTDEEGVVRKFATNGKKEKIDLGTARVDSQSKWDSTGVLTIEMTAGSARLTEMFQVTVEGHMLVETMKLQVEGASSSAPVPKRIFDRSE
jgi:hypothetical protein